MSSVHSFPPVCNAKTHTLILGTMPGVASLHAVEYYAHKRNALWPIVLASLLNKTPDFDLHQRLSYQEKINTLLEHGLGLWDVLASCERPGSLDSAIVKTTSTPNDFASLFEQLPNLQRIVLNGKTAQGLFFKHIALGKAKPNSNVETLELHKRSVSVFTLPSTSPAMASLNLKQKYDLWKSVIEQQPTTIQSN